MATSTPGQIRKAPAGKRNPWVAAQGPAGSSIVDSIARVEQRALASWREFVPWFKAQPDHVRVAFVAVGLVASISVVNLGTAGLGRIGTSHGADTAQTTQTVAAAAPASPVARVLRPEPAPVIPGTTWVATQLWQGSGNRATEAFTVGSHWRVDWLYNPPPAGAFLQVFIYSADGSLLTNIAANTAVGGPDSSFWAGAGTYFLKVNSNGGDWKLDVQDLR
jgi:hypothetical protein